MIDREEFARWRAEADRALQSARVQAGAGLHNWACFAAEQAAQLALKGLLRGIGRPPWGHDLVRLGTHLRQELGPGWPGALDVATRRLSRHDLPARYPDAHASGPPGAYYGPEDAALAIADSESLLGSVDRAWGAVGGAADRG